jgi:hypothetical protein
LLLPELAPPELEPPEEPPPELPNFESRPGSIDKSGEVLLGAAAGVAVVGLLHTPPAHVSEQHWPYVEQVAPTAWQVAVGPPQIPPEQFWPQQALEFAHDAPFAPQVVDAWQNPETQSLLQQSAFVAQLAPVAPQVAFPVALAQTPCTQALLQQSLPCWHVWPTSAQSIVPQRPFEHAPMQQSAYDWQTSPLAWHEAAPSRPSTAPPTPKGSEPSPEPLPCAQPKETAESTAAHGTTMRTSANRPTKDMAHPPGTGSNRARAGPSQRAFHAPTVRKPRRIAPLGQGRRGRRPILRDERGALGDYGDDGRQSGVEGKLVVALGAPGDRHGVPTTVGNALCGERLADVAATGTGTGALGRRRIPADVRTRPGIYGVSEVTRSPSAAFGSTRSAAVTDGCDTPRFYSAGRLT